MVISLTVVLVWLLSSEGYLLFRKRSNRSTKKNHGDRGSLLVLWIALPLSITCSIIWANNSPHIENNLSTITGLIFSVVGSVVRWISIKQLKQGFTVDVSIHEDHHLKTNGIFKRVRHPSYTGLILILVGIGVILNNTIAIIILLLPVFFAVNYRIYVEEKLLEQEFGDEYRHYKHATKRLIPFLY